MSIPVTMTRYLDLREGGPRFRSRPSLEFEMNAPPGPRSRPLGNSTLSLYPSNSYPSRVIASSASLRLHRVNLRHTLKAVSTYLASSNSTNANGGPLLFLRSIYVILPVRQQFGQIWQSKLREPTEFVEKILYVLSPHIRRQITDVNPRLLSMRHVQ